MNLFCKNCITNLRSVFSFIRSLYYFKKYFTHHKFIGDYSKSKVINSVAMILTTHHLRSCFNNKLPIYPGVPLVSFCPCWSAKHAIPKSVIRIYPCESKTKFYGFKSRCITFFVARYSNPNTMHAIKNPKLFFNYLFVINWISIFNKYEILNLHLQEGQ